MRRCIIEAMVAMMSRPIPTLSDKSDCLIQVKATIIWYETGPEEMVGYETMVGSLCIFYSVCITFAPYVQLQSKCRNTSH